uniref:Uncharacterized protein n=1 Tax=Arundo donax TaxID=35708 RepID=A0A0A8ZL12_ARUDO
MANYGYKTHYLRHIISPLAAFLIEDACHIFSMVYAYF